MIQIIQKMHLNIQLNGLPSNSVSRESCIESYYFNINVLYDENFEESLASRTFSVRVVFNFFERILWLSHLAYKLTWKRDFFLQAVIHFKNQSTFLLILLSLGTFFNVRRKDWLRYPKWLARWTVLKFLCHFSFCTVCCFITYTQIFR